MRNVLIAAILLLAPQAALAQQVTGTINVTGVVTGRCSVVGGGQSLADTMDLGELAGGDGRLRTDLTDVTPDGVRNFSVVCTAPAPVVKLRAVRLSNPAAAPAGYANAIDYTIAVAVTQASGTAPAVTYRTASALPPETSVTLTGPLANAPDNIVVRVYSFSTAPATALLVAGTYNSAIVVTISPS